VTVSSGLGPDSYFAGEVVFLLFRERKDQHEIMLDPAVLWICCAGEEYHRSTPCLALLSCTPHAAVHTSCRCMLLWGPFETLLHTTPSKHYRCPVPLPTCR
jgi:hypothetical protein